MPGLRLTPDQRLALTSFASRWRIADLALFGSALGEGYGPESDVDLLVTFEAEARWSLLDMARMQEEAEAIFGRAVDLVTRRAVERSRNPIRRAAILGAARPLLPA